MKYINILDLVIVNFYSLIIIIPQVALIITSPQLPANNEGP